MNSTHKRKTSLSLIASTTLLMGISASTVFANPIMDAKAADILKNINGEAPQIARSFDGPAGMRGHVLQGRSGEPSVLIWQTADGDHLMLGNLMDLAGRDLTNIAASHYGASNPLHVAVSMAVEAYNQALEPEDEGFLEIEDAATALRAAQSIPDSDKVVIKGGRSLHSIYIYVDPRCGYCHMLLEELDGYDLAAADIDLHLIPVAIIGAASEQIAAAALRANSLEHSLRFLRGDSSLSIASPEDVATVQRNSDILGQTMEKATPSVVAAFQGVPARAIIGPNGDDIVGIAAEYSIMINPK